MKKCIALLVAVVFVFLVSPATVAQELPKATKYEKVTWYTVGYYKFKPGKTDDVQKLLTDYFIPADKASGRAVINFDYLTGDWHHVAYFPMDGGASGLEWRVAPNDEKWWAALAKIAGGVEKAQELNDKFNEMVEESKTEVAMRPIP